ncbi:hypothetical protein ACG74X_20190 [Marivita sp. S0852]|uniref:hypothetical protein n=1 Tax=Marivita sp. S0852 TaxID=3373893 RepID=UPI0039825314
MAKRKSIDPQRRAEFREIAREIIREDRAAKKYGYSQNTIGAIERALKSAFLDGRAIGSGEIPDSINSNLTWEQLPPRARDTLSSMSFGFSARLNEKTYPPSAIRRFLTDGKYRWRTEALDGSLHDHSVADGSVRPLVKLGLIAEDPSADNRFELTTPGIEHCEDYWRRSDFDDPTLPKISLRPT